MSIEIVRGDAYTTSRRLVVTVRDPAGATVDLTGTSVRFMVKRKVSDLDADALLSMETGSGITLASPQSGATKGVAYLSLSDTDTDIVAGRYFYEVEATDAVGIVTLDRGHRFVVLADMIQGA